MPVYPRRKGIQNSKKSIFYAKHKFYIILIYSSSPRSIFIKPQFLSFLQLIQLPEKIRSHPTSQTPLYHVTKGVAGKRSGQ